MLRQVRPDQRYPRAGGQQRPPERRSNRTTPLCGPSCPPQFGSDSFPGASSAPRPCPTETSAAPASGPGGGLGIGAQAHGGQRAPQRGRREWGPTGGSWSGPMRSMAGGMSPHASYLHHDAPRTRRRTLGPPLVDRRDGGLPRHHVHLRMSSHQYGVRLGTLIPIELVPTGALPAPPLSRSPLRPFSSSVPSRLRPLLCSSALRLPPAPHASCSLPSTSVHRSHCSRSGRRRESIESESGVLTHLKWGTAGACPPTRRQGHKTEAAPNTS